MNDPNGLTLYVSEVFYEYYSRNGLPSPFTRLVKTAPLPMMAEEARREWEEVHVSSIKLANGEWWTVTYTVVVKDEKPVEIKVTKQEQI